MSLSATQIFESDIFNWNAKLFRHYIMQRKQSSLPDDHIQSG